MCRTLAARWTFVVMLLGALGYAQVGYLAHFEAKRKTIQRGIKDRIRKGVPKDELTRFVLTKEEWEALTWVKPGREFRLPNGNMYDVVEILQETDTVDAWCIHDHAETVLFAGLKDHVARGMEGPDTKGGSRLLVVRLMQLVDLPPPPPSLPGSVCSPLGSAPWKEPIRKGFLQGWSPPPDTSRC